MVGNVGPSAMSAMARITMGIQEQSSDFGVASLNIANGFANQDNPFGFSRLSPNNVNGPAFTDISSMGGLSGSSAVSSSMVNAIQGVNFDTPHTDNAFSDAIESITLSEGLYDIEDSEASEESSSAALIAALVAMAGTGGAVASASATATAAITSIGDTSTIGEGAQGAETSSDPAAADAPPAYTETSLTSSGGSGSGEAMSGLGGSSELSGDAQQMKMSETIATVADFVSNDETRAESGVGVAETTKDFRKMEAQTKLQDDREILHAKVLSQVLMGV